MRKKIETSPNQRSDALASLGNQSYWSGWLSSLEMEIENRREVDGSLADAACYVSWLLLSAEYIVYRLRWYFYVVGDFKETQVFNYGYTRLLNKCIEAMPTEIQEQAKFAVRVRHIFVHKGFPNPQEEPAKRSDDFFSGETDVKETLDQIVDLANYEKVKLQFHAVHSWLKEHTPNFTFGV